MIWTTPTTTSPRGGGGSRRSLRACAARCWRTRRSARLVRCCLSTEARLTGTAQNPKQQAFFHAIEDREDSQMLDFLDGEAFVPDSQTEESQNVAPAEGGDVERPALSEISTNIPAMAVCGPLATTTLKR